MVDNTFTKNGAAHAFHLIGNPHSGVSPIAYWQIEQPGFFTTVQDGGRAGYQQYGYARGRVRWILKVTN